MFAVSAVRAAVRLPRTATVRRALLTALFLCGLMALALLAGERAQAASVEREERNPVRFLEERHDSHRPQALAARDRVVKTAESGRRLHAEADRALKGSEVFITTPADETARSIRTALRTASGTLEGKLPGHPGSASEEDRDRNRVTPGADRCLHSHHAELSPSQHGGHLIGVTRSSGLDDADQRSAHDGRSESDAPVPFPVPRLPAAPVASFAAGEGGGTKSADQLCADAGPSPPGFALLPGAVSGTDGSPTCARHRDILEFPG